MRVWRIATDTRAYAADDLSGAGAKTTGGRWNRAGTAVLYCAATPALACLEPLELLGSSSLPLNRYLVAIDIPEPVWQVREILIPASLPAAWDASPTGKASLDMGDEWLKSCRSAVMAVPSAIVPEDTVVLINPLHRDVAGITALKTRKWLYDPRLL